MLLGYRGTASPAWTIAGTGAAFLSDIQLDGGNPAAVTRFSWLSSGTPAIGQYVDLRSDFASPRVPRLIVLVGLSVPVGTKLEVRGKRISDPGYTYALGGNSTSQRTVEMWDGSVGAVICCDADLDAVVGYEVRMFNDVAGATWATAATFVGVGVIDLFEAVELCGRPGYSWETVDGTENEETLGAQIYSAPWRPYRSLSVEVVPTDYTEALAEGLAQDQDWQRIQWHLSRGKRCVLALRENGFGSALDADSLQRETVYGIASKFGPIGHVAGALRRFVNSYAFREVPAA